YSFEAPSAIGSYVTVSVPGYVEGYGWGHATNYYGYDNYPIYDSELVPGADVYAKDFTFNPNGTISGSIVDGNEALITQQVHLWVDAYDNVGHWKRWDVTTSSGTYTLPAIAGTSYVHMDTFL